MRRAVDEKDQCQGFNRHSLSILQSLIHGEKCRRVAVVVIDGVRFCSFHRPDNKMSHKGSGRKSKANPIPHTADVAEARKT